VSKFTDVCDVESARPGPESMSRPAALHVALPRAAAITDVLLSPPGPVVTQHEVEGARSLLIRELRDLHRSMPGTSPFRIDSYRLQLALRSPQQLSSLDCSFSPSPASCRRAIGTEAVSLCVREPGVSPAQAVAEVLNSTIAYPDDAERSWWREWFLRIPPGARAVVQSEAVTWATQLFGALEWSRLQPNVRVGNDFRWECPGARGVTVHAKIDVRVLVDNRPVFFLVPTGTPGPHWSAALSLAALGAALAGGAESLPARVVGLWPASGQVRILPVQSGTLDRAARLVIEAARVLCQAGPRATPATSGPAVGRS